MYIVTDEFALLYASWSNILCFSKNSHCTRWCIHWTIISANLVRTREIMRKLTLRGRAWHHIALDEFIRCLSSGWAPSGLRSYRIFLNLYDKNSSLHIIRLSHSTVASLLIQPLYLNTAAPDSCHTLLNALFNSHICSAILNSMSSGFIPICIRSRQKC